MAATEEKSSTDGAKPIAPDPGAPKRRRRARAAAWMIAALVIAFGVFSCATRRALKQEIANTPRNETTGVVKGAEAVFLGPEDAEAACLLFHGFVGSRIDFADLGERLADAGFRVRMTRMPGHGTTPVDFAKQTPEDFERFALEEFRALKADYPTVHVVGFSMGGAVATLLAAEEDVDRLALIAPFYGVTYRWFYILPPMTWNRIFSPIVPYTPKPNLFVQVNKRESVDKIFSYRHVPTRGADTLMRLGKMASSPETLGAIDGPVLLLHAEGDQAADPAKARAAFEAFASDDKTAHWYDERLNHHLFWDYEAEDVASRVVEFLSAE